MSWAQTMRESPARRLDAGRAAEAGGGPLGRLQRAVARGCPLLGAGPVLPVPDAQPARRPVRSAPDVHDPDPPARPRQPRVRRRQPARSLPGAPLSALWIVRAQLLRVDGCVRPSCRGHRLCAFDLDDTEYSLISGGRKRSTERARLRRTLRQLEARPLLRDGLYFRNAAMQLNALGIDGADREIFTLLVHARLDDALEEAMGGLLRGEACLRRFDLKVRFDAPTTEQVWRLFLGTLGADSEGARREVDVDPAMRAVLARLPGLTPGDFATAVRRAGVLGQALDARTLLAALKGEWNAKPEGARRALGFGRGE